MTPVSSAAVMARPASDVGGLTAPTWGNTASAPSDFAFSVAIPHPTGVVSGTIVLVSIYLEDDGVVVPPGSGTGAWTEIVNVENNTASATFRAHLFWKRATTSESGGTYTFTNPAAWVFGTATAIQGCVSTGTPIEQISIGVTTANSATLPTVQMTTRSTQNLLYWAGFSFVSGAFTEPSGFTERHDISRETSIATLTQASIGDTGALAGSASNTSHISILASLTPATPVAIPSPTFVAASTLVASDTGTTIAATAPAGKVNGDLLIMPVWANLADTISTPTGWNVLVAAVSNANMSRAWFWRIATGGADDTPTITFSAAGSATNGHFCRQYGYRGTDQTSPIDTGATALFPTANTTPDSDQLSVRGLNRLCVVIIAVDDDNTWSSGMPPSGWANGGGITTSTIGGDAMSDSIYRSPAGAITQESLVMGTMSASDPFSILSCALVPAAPTGLTATLISSGDVGGEAGHPTTIVTPAISPGANCLLVLMAGGTVNDGSGPSLFDGAVTVTSSGSGPTWTRSARGISTSIGFGVSAGVFTATTGESSPGSFTITVDFPGSLTSYSHAWVLYKVTGYDAEVPFTGARATYGQAGNGAVTVLMNALPAVDDISLALSVANTATGSTPGAVFGSTYGTWTQNATSSGSEQVAWVAGQRTGSTDNEVEFSDVNAATAENWPGGSAQAAVVVKAPFVPSASPIPTIGLWGWFDADAIVGLTTGDPVATWTDASGIGHDLTQATSGSRPTWVTGVLNSLPVVRFTNDFMSFADPGLVKPVTMIYVIVQRTDPGSNAGIFDAGSTSYNAYVYFDGGTNAQSVSTGSFMTGQVVTVNVPYIGALLNDGSNSKIWMNGGTAMTGNPGSLEPGGLTIGAAAGGGESSVIDVAEVLVYDRELTTAELNEVGEYLETKWAITWSTV